MTRRMNDIEIGIAFWSAVLYAALQRRKSIKTVCLGTEENGEPIYGQVLPPLRKTT
jgi:hypothetical protein